MKFDLKMKNGLVVLTPEVATGHFTVKIAISCQVVMVNEFSMRWFHQEYHLQKLFILTPDVFPYKNKQEKMIVEKLILFSAFTNQVKYKCMFYFQLQHLCISVKE